MLPAVRYFGAHGSFQISVGQDQGEITHRVVQAIGFDRDLDGRWTVWAKRMPDPATNCLSLDDDDAVGAIIVTDPTVVAFIELLGELVANPTRFRHEPRFEAPHQA